MGLVAYLEDVRLIDEAEAAGSSLKIVEGVAEVALSGEDDRLEAVVGEGDGLGGADGLEAGQDLRRAKRGGCS